MVEVASPGSRSNPVTAGATPAKPLQNEADSIDNGGSASVSDAALLQKLKEQLKLTQNELKVAKENNTFLINESRKKEAS